MAGARPALCAAVILSAASRQASAEAPLSYLAAHGAKADKVLPLTWGLAIISLLVVAIITALVLWALFRPRSGGPEVADTKGVTYISAGVALTLVVLFGSVVWTMVVLADTAHPQKQPALKVEVTGEQWWWKVRYDSDEPQQIFTTANEIHIPVGEPVAVELRSDNVIHSFWVPALSGKTDVIPGQLNTTWIEAKEPGTYAGQCAEFCGLQHANMALRVIAEPKQRFEAWRAEQLKPDAGSADAGGVAVFMQRCAACHALRGTEAGGMIGPDLTHLASRTTLAAGTLPNTPGYLSAWILDPQHFKPGAKMPAIPLSGDELERLRHVLDPIKPEPQS